MKKALILLSILIQINAYAQQDAMYTHYSFNTLAINPAYAGSRDLMSITGLHRSQWVGFDGAPVTQTLTFHSPLFIESLGIGVSLVQDKIGPIKMTSFYGDFSYRVNISKNTKLSFGIKSGGNLIQGDLTSLYKIDEQDGDIVNIGNRFLPNIGGGLYLYNEKWFAGISAPKLLQNSYFNNTSGVLTGEQRHYYLSAGLVIPLTNTLKLKPTTFIKATEAAPMQLDVTTMLIFKDKIEIGLMGRTGEGLGVLLGYNFNPQLRVGYSFDWSYENTSGLYNNGSHEVMVRYDIINSSPNKVYSPRYF